MLPAISSANLTIRRHSVLIDIVPPDDLLFKQMVNFAVNQLDQGMSLDVLETLFPGVKFRDLEGAWERLACSLQLNKRDPCSLPPSESCEDTGLVGSV